MQDTLVKSDVLKGGEYLIKPSKPEDTLIPEQINEEQQMIKDRSYLFLICR